MSIDPYAIYAVSLDRELEAGPHNNTRYWKHREYSLFCDRLIPNCEECEGCGVCTDCKWVNLWRRSYANLDRYEWRKACRLILRCENTPNTRNLL